jgi:SNF2-related domain
VQWVQRKPAPGAALSTPGKKRARKSAKGVQAAGAAEALAASPVAADRPRKVPAGERALHEAAAAAAEPDAPPAADGPSATLIVCPVSVLSNWEAQLNEHTDGSLSMCKYYGGARAKHKPTALAKHDVVLTTYGVLVADERVLTKVRPVRVATWIVTLCRLQQAWGPTVSHKPCCIALAVAGM